MGVDPAECRGGNRDKTRQAWGIQSDAVVVGHLANQSREKGTVDLLEAAEILWKQGKQFRLVLAGPEMPNFRSFWKTWRPKEAIIRIGEIDDQLKRDFFAAIDLFALPSRSDSFGLVLLEAWAKGVPNVAYRAGGVAEVIRHEQDGLLVRCGKIDELAAALAHLIDNDSWRRRLGTCGRDRVACDFRWEEKLSRVWQTYRGVVEEELCQPKHTVAV